MQISAKKEARKQGTTTFEVSADTSGTTRTITALHSDEVKKALIASAKGEADTTLKEDLGNNVDTLKAMIGIALQNDKMKLSTGIFQDLKPVQQKQILNKLTAYITNKFPCTRKPARKAAIDRFLKPLTDAVNKHETAKVVSTTTAPSTRASTPPSINTGASAPPPPSTSTSTSAPSTTGIQARTKGKGRVKYDSRNKGSYWSKERLKAAEKQAKARNQNQAGVELQDMGTTTQKEPTTTTRDGTTSLPRGKGRVTDRQRVAPSAVTDRSEAKQELAKCDKNPPAVAVSVKPSGGE